MKNSTQDRRERPQQTGDTARAESTAPRVVLCAVTDDDHLHDVVATGRALQRTGSFQALFVHVATPAVRLRVPLGFAAAGGTRAAATLPLGSSLDDLDDHAEKQGSSCSSARASRKLGRSWSSASLSSRSTESPSLTTPR